MSLNTDVRAQMQQVEYQKFAEIQNDSNFPPVSTISWQYPDTGQNPVSSMQVFPKYAVLTYDVGSNGTNGLPFGDNSTTDAFGRLRISNPTTLMDVKLLYDKQPFMFDEVVNGTATSTFSANDSCVVMRTAAPGDYVIRQTRVHFNYQPGKSILSMFTGLAAPEPNIIKRIGVFQSLSSAPYEPSDGIYLEVIGSGPRLVVTKTLGTPATTTIPQSAWNVDRLDGTGPSGISLDFTKTILFTIDYEWLGVGRIRFGFNIGGKTYYCHYESHLNELTVPYMTSPNQPARYEIRQTGVGSGMMKHICATVISEGGADDDGVNGMMVSATLSAAVTVNRSSNPTFNPVLALRFNPVCHDLVAIIKNIEFLNLGSSGEDMIYELRLNPTISPDLNWQNLDTNFLQMAAGGLAYSLTSPGYKLLGGYAGGGNARAIESTDISRSLARLGTAINGTPDVLVICARTFASSDKNCLAAMNILIKA
jgi:hypothetical protein